MSSKYVDQTAIIQVIGCVYKNPLLLDMSDKYKINEEDFPDRFHRIVFGTIYKLHEQGLDRIVLDNIVDFLETKPKSKAVFDLNKGIEYLKKVEELAEETSFNYYYNRLKKFTLLRAYDRIGLDLSDVYDIDNLFDLKKKEQQDEFLDNATLTQIADIIDDKIDNIRNNYVNDNDDRQIIQAGEGVQELIDQFLANPEIGIPLYGDLINGVTLGARLKKFYLRSASTGLGKTRTMASDACYVACNKYYTVEDGWVDNNNKSPTMFIATEQDLSEMQTMFLSFLSGVNEEHILKGKYEQDEYERICTAATILKDSPLYVEEIPDYSLLDIENAIKKGIRDYGIKYVFFDYIQSTMKILEEITSRSGGVRLREDNILFMLSVKLKDLCNQYGVFIMSATQLSGDIDSKTPDQRLLRGAKSIADKADVGMILMDVTTSDRETLQEWTATQGYELPDIKMSIYKNRRGKYKSVYLWGNRDLGCCRIKWNFCTDWNYKPVAIEDLKIEVNPIGTLEF